MLPFEFERRLYSDLKIEIQAVTVLERGTPPVDDTNVEIISDLLQSQLFGDDSVTYNQVVDFLLGLIEEDGIGILFDPEYGLNVLQQFQKLSDTSRKISVIESDDYVQVKLTYYY